MYRKDLRSIRPETKLQHDIIRLLRWHEWVVISTHGNAQQQGFPDLYCCHPRNGQRWIEVKVPKKYSFTAAQEEYFPIISKSAGIWIMQYATESEYKKLFNYQNWYHFLQVNRKRKVLRPSEEGNRDLNEPEIVTKLEREGWFIMQTHGNLFQKGLPDLYCVHAVHGQRWIEIKNPNRKWTFTGAQLKYFPMMDACHVRIWIIQYPDEYNLLFKKHNLREFL